MYPSFFGMSSYWLLVGLGLLGGLALFAWRGRNRGVQVRTSILLGGDGLVAGAFGLRLLYWLFFPTDFVSTAVAFLLPSGGVALNGGIILIIATVAGLCRLRGLSFLALADVMVPSGPLAILFFRLGCFCNGCCLGRPTDISWGIKLPANSTPALLTAGAVVHPTPLYAALSAGLILVLLLWLEKRQVPQGVLFAVFLVMYGFFRATIDLTRRVETRAGLETIFELNQAINLSLGLAGVILLVWLEVRRRNLAQKARTCG